MNALLRRGLLLALLAVGLSASAQEVVLKVHHFWPANAMPPTRILQPWCDAIAADSKNKLKCDIHPAMQLGGTPPQLIDQAKTGVVDVVFTLPGYTLGRFPVMEVFELPFVSRSAEATSKAAWEFYEKYGKNEFAGLHPLMFAVHDNGYLHTRDKQIKTLADMKGLRFRAPTRMTGKLLTSLGAVPMAMPLPKVPEAVSKGVIDGFMLPWEVIPSIGLHELVKYDTETDTSLPALYTAVFTIAMNPAKYDSLPPDLKAVIDKNSYAGLSATAGQIWDYSQGPGRQAAIKHGNILYTIPAAELNNWIKASSHLYDEWTAEMDKQGLPGKQMLQDARAMIAKHQKQ